MYNRINNWTYLFLAALCGAFLVGYNIQINLNKDDSIPELPPEKVELPDIAAKMDEEWRAKVKAQRDEEAQDKEEQMWRADIKRELHSMRAQYNIFLRENHRIEAERREAARQERIRIQKQKAAERAAAKAERIRQQKEAKEKRAAERAEKRKHKHND